MLPPSNSLISCPSLCVSVIAGILPFGLIFRNHGSFCAFVEISTWVVSYGKPSSSSAMLILMPLGVESVYNLMLGRLAIVVWDEG